MTFCSIHVLSFIIIIFGSVVSPGERESCLGWKGMHIHLPCVCCHLLCQAHDNKEKTVCFYLLYTDGVKTVNICLRFVKQPALKTKALTPDLFILGAAGSQNIVHRKFRKGSIWHLNTYCSQNSSDTGASVRENRLAQHSFLSRRGHISTSRLKHSPTVVLSCVLNMYIYATCTCLLFCRLLQVYTRPGSQLEHESAQLRKYSHKCSSSAF